MGLNLGPSPYGVDPQVIDIAGLTPTDNGVVIGNGTNFVVETGNTLMTSLSLNNVENKSSSTIRGELTSGNVTTALTYTPLSSTTREMFLAHKNNTSQTSISTGDTIVTFGTEAFDIGSKYDTTTSTWTPSAGRVMLSCTVFMSNLTAATTWSIQVFKNGALFKNHVVLASTPSNTVTCMDTANGTDAYKINLNCTTAGSGQVEGSQINSWFEGRAI